MHNNIPTFLKSYPNWVVWGIQNAPLKSPFNPESLINGYLSPAKAGIKGTWGNYSCAVECVKRGLAKGIGYEFDNNGIYGVDLDHVIDGSGTLTPQAQEVVSKLNSYTEISPSGTGIHVFVHAPDANVTRHRKKDYFLEIYNEGRYFTVTGNVLGDIKPIENRTTELQTIHDKFLLPDTSKSVGNIPPTTYSSTNQDKFLNIGLKRDKVFSALWDGERRNGNESADDIALMNKLAYWCNADSGAMIQAFFKSPYYMQKDEPHKQKCQRCDYLPNTAKNSATTVYSTAIADYERWQQGRKNERSYAR